jgi:hypothetical protein
MSDFLSHLLDRVSGTAPVLERRQPALFEPLPEISDLGWLGHQVQTRQGTREEDEAFSEIEADELLQSLDGGSPTAHLEQRPDLFTKRKKSTSAAHLEQHPLLFTQRKKSTPAPLSDGESIRAVPKSQEFEPSVGGEVEDAPDNKVASEKPIQNVKPAAPRPLPTRSTNTFKETVSRPNVPPLQTAESVSEPTLRKSPRIELNKGEETRYRSALSQESSTCETKSSALGEAISQGRPAKEGSVEQMFLKPKTRGTPPDPVPTSRNTALAAYWRAIPPVREKSAPSTIHVTIGRVEVRAIQQSQTAERTPKPRVPNLKLEDYLRSRSGVPR